MEKVYNGEEFKRIIFETAGIPENILECSDLLYSKIFEHLNNNKNEPIPMWKEFFVEGNFRIMDFEVNKIRVRIVIDRVKYDKNIEFKNGGNVDNAILTNNYKLKTQEYSIENNYLLLTFETSANYIVTFINILKYFKNNEEYIKSVIVHELKHAFDDFKKPLSPLLKHGEYKGYDYRTDIPPINNLIYGMYYTHDFERLVRNTEFYSLLNQRNIKKSEFNDFLVNSETYQIIKKMRDLTLDKIINTIKLSYLAEVDNFLITLKYNPEIYTPDQKIDIVFEKTYDGIKDLTIEYLGKFLLDVSKPILNSMQQRRLFYDKEVQKKANADYMKYFNDKIKEINKNADLIIHKIGKLYDLLNEEVSYEFMHDGSKMNNGKDWVIA